MLEGSWLWFLLQLEKLLMSNGKKSWSKDDLDNPFAWNTLKYIVYILILTAMNCIIWQSWKILNFMTWYLAYEKQNLDKGPSLKYCTKCWCKPHPMSQNLCHKTLIPATLWSNLRMAPIFVFPRETLAPKVEDFHCLSFEKITDKILLYSSNSIEIFSKNVSNLSRNYTIYF